MSRKPSQSTLDKHNVEKHKSPWHLDFHLGRLSRSSRPKTPTSKPTSRVSSRAGSQTGSRRGSPKPKPLDFTKDIPTNIPYPPFINVEGVPNFRDLGGFKCLPPDDVPSDVGLEFSVRRGFAFRCSEMSQITPVGLVTLNHDLNIKTLYDLRGEREAADRRGQPQGVNCISTPVFRKEDVTHEMVVQQLTWSTAPDNPPDAGFSQGYVDWYRQILMYGAKHAFRAIFEHIISQPDAPILYHCTAGKDRTGVLSAVILNLCGVDDHAVAWEYSLTVPGMGVWEEAVEQEMVGDSMMPIRSHGGMTREEARRVCGSRASNMAQFVKVVLKGECGGAANYLKEYCGFTDAQVAAIRSALIVPGEATVRPVSFPGYEEHVQT